MLDKNWILGLVAGRNSEDVLECALNFEQQIEDQFLTGNLNLEDWFNILALWLEVACQREQDETYKQED